MTATLLAADVGGTYARIGLVQIGDGRPTVVRHEKYACAQYPGLGAILRHFLAAAGAAARVPCAIACAGYVLDDVVVNDNLPWRVTLTGLRRDVGTDDLFFVNDFTAIAYGTIYLRPEDVFPIVSVSETLDGPILVVGPGTGLGAAVCIRDESGPIILPTEAGHGGLTPATQLEVEILQRLLRDATHIPAEHILSGPGLGNLYRVLGEIRGQGAQALSPAQITAAALERNEPLARETMDVFCGWLGGVAGNLVLQCGAQGGVYLAGGILPQIREFLQRSDFVARFCDKGARRSLLERVSVGLIEHGQLGVLGAAGLYTHHHRRR
jgi:glucokinase